MNSKDLNLAEEIFPYFDYTNNNFAEALLLKLLTVPLSTKEAIYKRQQIIRGFDANWEAIRDFAYQRVAFAEVYSFLENVVEGKVALEKSRAKASVSLLVNSTKRIQLESRLVQTFLFFDNFNRKFLKQLDVNPFPEPFKHTFRNIYKFIDEVDALKFNNHNANLSISDIIEFYQAIEKLGSQGLKEFWEAFFEVEVFFSITKGIKVNGFCLPSFSEDGSFKINGFYHPVLKNPIKNSLELDAKDKVILLTGPNMSGKSTLLRTLGLCVFLSHVGIGVPASACTIPFYDRIAISINVEDSLQNGYSHFMREVINLKDVLIAANTHKRCFAIFDELFRGTNIDDATDITLSTVNGLTNYTGCLFFISTHILTMDHLITNGGVRKLNLECYVEGATPLFTYQLKDGWSDLKIGKILFDQEGITGLLNNSCISNIPTN